MQIKTLKNGRIRLSSARMQTVKVGFVTTIILRIKLVDCEKNLHRTDSVFFNIRGESRRRSSLFNSRDRAVANYFIQTSARNKRGPIRASNFTSRWYHIIYRNEFEQPKQPTAIISRSTLVPTGRGLRVYSSCGSLKPSINETRKT